MRCLSVLDLVILFIFFFLAAKLKRSVNSLKTSIFRYSVTFGVFVCLGFGHFILFVYFFPWPRSSKGPRMGRQFFKNVDFSVTYPLKGV